MDKVISEIVIGGLILSLLFFLVPMYRQSYDLVNKMASKADYSKKIKEVILPDLTDATSALGRDVIAFIRYYELKGGVVIMVNDFEYGLYLYGGTSYIPEKYYIDPAREFELRITYPQAGGNIIMAFTSRQ